MKKMFLLTAITMMLTAIVTVAQAEVSAGSFSVTPFIGGYVFEGNEYDLKTTYVAGLRVGYNLKENWAVEGFFNYVPTQVQNADDADVTLYGYGIEGLYLFMPKGHFVPFLAIGLGGIHYSIPSDPDGMNKYAVDYGAGLKYLINDNIALRADIRHVIPLNDTYNDFLCTFGISYSFGGKKKEVTTAKYEEPVIAPKIEAPAPPKEVVVAPKAEEPVAPKENAVATEPVFVPPPAAAPADNLTQVSSKQSETITIPEEDVRNLINKWLTSWQSGDMETYRSCYASDFQSKGMNLNGWIAYKTNVHKKSKNINISIDNPQISADAKNATAVFTQSYTSSILKDKGKKTLELRKINDEWKIYREIM
jgi:outer membrane beta-barrel protein